LPASSRTSRPFAPLAPDCDNELGALFDFVAHVPAAAGHTPASRGPSKRGLLESRVGTPTSGRDAVRGSVSPPPIAVRARREHRGRKAGPRALPPIRVAADPTRTPSQYRSPEECVH